MPVDGGGLTFALSYFTFRPWPNDQTLWIQHLKFVCQAKCLTVWPRPKTLFGQQHFCVLCQHRCWSKLLTRPNGQTFVVKQIWNVGATMFDRLARALELLHCILYLIHKATTTSLTTTTTTKTTTTTTTETFMKTFLWIRYQKAHSIKQPGNKSMPLQAN